MVTFIDIPLTLKSCRWIRRATVVRGNCSQSIINVASYSTAAGIGDVVIVLCDFSAPTLRFILLPLAIPVRGICKVPVDVVVAGVQNVNVKACAADIGNVEALVSAKVLNCDANARQLCVRT